MVYKKILHPFLFLHRKYYCSCVHKTEPNLSNPELLVKTKFYKIVAEELIWSCLGFDKQKQLVIKDIISVLIAKEMIYKYIYEVNNLDLNLFKLIAKYDPTFRRFTSDKKLDIVYYFNSLQDICASLLGCDEKQAFAIIKKIYEIDGRSKQSLITDFFDLLQEVKDLNINKVDYNDTINSELIEFISLLKKKKEVIEIDSYKFQVWTDRSSFNNRSPNAQAGISVFWKNGTVSFIYVRDHMGNYRNEQADRLLKEGLLKEVKLLEENSDPSYINDSDIMYQYLINNLGFDDPSIRATKFKTCKSIFVKNVKKLCDCKYFVRFVREKLYDLFKSSKKNNVCCNCDKEEYLFEKCQDLINEIYTEKQGTKYVFCKYVKELLEIIITNIFLVIIIR
ncbi:13568_t:CDS:2 [Gigaspora margarita]|uniref:13568_t:CDS:1 n=1 Tax=Gigaspora margarita TaxID=4874 RepID=A0ABN7UK19_GIGMA|nr:13568_t:CDS:2 [Gigaspora margarita]